MNRAAPLAFILIAALALTGCAHKRIRPGPPPTGPRYVIGYPYQSDGEWHYPRAVDAYDRTGLATIIPPGHTAATTDGEAYDPNGLMAQSPILPLPSLVAVTNLVTGRTITLRVNERGPATAGRIIAVTRHAAALLGFPASGVVEVRVRLLAGRSSSLQTALGAGPHLTAAPVAGVQSSALPPPPGAAGSAGALNQPAATQTTSAPATTPTSTLSGIVHAGTPDPGPLYVEIGGFGSGSDAQNTLYRLAGMQGRIVPQPDEGRTLYAVKLGPYRSVAAADAGLRAVLARGVPDPEIIVH